MTSLRNDLPEGVLTRSNMRSSLDRLNYQIQSYGDRSTEDPQAFESIVMHDNLKVISVTPETANDGPTKTLPFATFSLVIKPEMCSAIGQLHGAATTLIFDMTTSMIIAPCARPGFWEFHGVSRNPSVSYYRPVPVGARVIVETRVVQIGKTLATIMAELKSESGGLLASAKHDKVQVDALRRLVKM